MVFILGLAACAPKAQAAPQSANPGAFSGTPGPRNSLESRLAAGTLKLEGTSQAVTADEAKTLLPLWQQIQTMSADTSTNPADIQAVYQKIEQAMTSDQVQAIQNLSLTQSDIQTLAQNLGLQITPIPTLSPEEQATRQAQRQSRGSGTGSTGGNGGYPSGTPGAFSGRGGFGGFGFEQMFIDPLITLLQQRAGG